MKDVIFEIRSQTNTSPVASAGKEDFVKDLSLTMARDSSIAPFV